MKLNKLYIVTSLVLLTCLVFILFQNRMNTRLKTEIKSLSYLIDKQEFNIKQRIEFESKLSRKNYNHLSDGDSIIYMYIPTSICNECYESIYIIIKELCLQNDYKLHILSSEKSYRDNLMYFGDWNVQLSVLNIIVKQTRIVLFRKTYNEIENVLCIGKNEVSVCKLYFKTIENLHRN